MTVLTASAVLALATSCQALWAPQTIVGLAYRESGWDTAAIHRNADGSEDRGLLQINERNFSLLGLTADTAMDPCRNIAAGARFLAMLSRYNTGLPTGTRGEDYAINVTAAIRAFRERKPGADISNAHEVPPAAAPSCTTPDITGWHVAISDCPQQTGWRVSASEGGR